ncbi:hypothetical protein BpHYR1_001362 [Brachionus plicatilis]|uniref:Uncharacterized protein n=1 Tax=Brachionus plicatilis TaxID=10195 RepID=A0A3M7SKU9_BRAPC|nr:hypothetical protein BpHYR1_001362 [Brachionus plicatilis]
MLKQIKFSRTLNDIGSQFSSKYLPITITNNNAFSKNKSRPRNLSDYFKPANKNRTTLDFNDSFDCHFQLNSSCWIKLILVLRQNSVLENYQNNFSTKRKPFLDTVQFKTNLYISFPRLFLDSSSTIPVGKGKVEEELRNKMRTKLFE